MPSVLPTIPNDPPQGIQALLDKVYLWNPDVSNDLIEKINALLVKLGDAVGAIRPYNEMVAPINQYEPCYYGNGVYVAKVYLAERAEEFNEEDWILIATKTDETKLLSKEEAAETYLPLTGGELTGLLTLHTKSDDNSSFVPVSILQLIAETKDGKYKATTNIKMNPSSGAIDFGGTALSGIISLFPYSETANIGHNLDSGRWNCAYVKKLNNGADLNIPTLAGTLARLEDLTAGNVSINFAGQEDTLQNAIDTLKTDQGELGDQVSAIESKIPADASETNQLITKNEVLALPTFTYEVVNELPETGEEKVIYLVPKAGEGNDVHDEYIWVNGAYELIGTTAVDLSDYLPLSGGTLTGGISFDILMQPFSSVPIIGSAKDSSAYFYAGSSNTDYPTYFGVHGGFAVQGYLEPTYIGKPMNKVQLAYVRKINNGADIDVPTKGGTLALVEDIAEAGTTVTIRNGA